MRDTQHNSVANCLQNGSKESLTGRKILKSNMVAKISAFVYQIIYSKGIDKPLAFLFVSYTKPIDETHNCEEVRENIRHLVLELAVLLEIRNYDF